MTRALAISLLACAPLLFGAERALAQDCFCGAQPVELAAVPGVTVLGATVLGDGVLGEGVLGADAPETPDTTIESADPSAADPSEGALVVAAHAHAPVTPLWCTSGSDPRCMPMEPVDSPVFRALSGGPVATTFEMISALRASRVARVLDAVTPAVGLAPARGVRTGIDRPPRR